MKVCELIELLKTLPQHKEVYVMHSWDPNTNTPKELSLISSYPITTTDRIGVPRCVFDDAAIKDNSNNPIVLSAVDTPLPPRRWNREKRRYEYIDEEAVDEIIKQCLD